MQNANILGRTEDVIITENMQWAAKEPGLVWQMCDCHCLYKLVAFNNKESVHWLFISAVTVTPVM